MVGFLVRHPGLGEGRIVEKQNGCVRIKFFDSGEEQTLTSGYHRLPLGLQSRCSAERGTCQIVSRQLGPDWQSPHRYDVMFEDGVCGQLSECELSPVKEKTGTACASPLEALMQLQQEGYSTFEYRETLLEQYLQMLRGGLGVRALLSSRIDLMPHQAYVAGVVLLDQRARYILADEVGLGKTIEAGIVLHDLLARKADARILVLCPGTLTQQWLCEIYAKFCGRVFRLPELIDGLMGHSATGEGQIILSFRAALQRQEDLLAKPWDLVIVDEAHHLLEVPTLYDFAQKLSAGAVGVLLLSALPAQRREEEYLRLLALLEPDRYHPDEPGETARFCALYSLQRRLGRELRWVARRLDDLAAGHRRPEDIIKRLHDLTNESALAHDLRFRALVHALDGTSPSFAEDVQIVLHHIADNHRINRRILRNRRARLIEDQAVPAIVRSLHRLPYPPDPLESEALEYVRRLLRQIVPTGTALAPLAKLLFQACCDPGCLVETLALAVPAGGVEGATEGWSTALDGVLGYADHHAQVKSLWKAVAAGMDNDALRLARQAAAVWREDEGSWGRFQELVRFLKVKLRAERQVKLLLFAGSSGLAERLHRQLRAEFPERRLARFHFGMSEKEKEEQARLFRRDAETFLLVTDETGGEGRNFQFADELIHYDTPWHAARVEQRIGRLDRLRRQRLDVVSNALCAAGSEEDGLVTVFDEGLGVYRASISGLEFALRTVENELVTMALAAGAEGMTAAVAAIREQAAAERAEDESADLFDAASIERRAADDFRRAQSTPEREKSLEAAFNNYFRYIAPGPSIHSVKQPDSGDGVFRYQPGDVRHIPLVLPPGMAVGTLPPPEGTFRREFAQERPNLEFFSVGNIFFDAVCGSLFTALSGRTYAIETIQGAGEWRGFEFGFRIVPGEELDGEPGLLNQFNRLFAFQMERVWVREDGVPSTKPDNLLIVRRRCTRDRKDAQWWNLTKEKTGQLDQFYAARGGWTQTVCVCYEVACKLARPRFEEKLAQRLADERARLHEQRRQLASLKPQGWTEEIAAIERLGEALDSWTVALDSAGFLSAGKRTILV